MRRERVVAAVGVLCAVVASAEWLTACGPKRVKKDQIAEMMKKTHQGEKAPFAHTRAELKKDSPDWETLAKDAKAFTEMAEALATRRQEYTSPAKYTEAAAQLTKATAKKDKPAAVAAFAGLSKSCASCHHYAAPGRE